MPYKFCVAWYPMKYTSSGVFGIVKLCEWYIVYVFTLYILASFTVFSSLSICPCVSP